MNKKRSDNPAKFFSEKEREDIIKAIQMAEKQTSGEIRLHLEKKSKKDIYDRAVKVFNKIGMHKTAQKNGVLIYLATANRKFVILGDQGINEVVPENFWADVANLMSEFFKKGDFSAGVCKGVTLIGQKLKDLFPYENGDINELTDDISIK
jgi:uncharacterized membrane protein